MPTELLVAVGDSVPTWTNKEVMIAAAQLIGGLIAAAVPIVVFLLRHFTENARRAEQEKHRRSEAENPYAVESSPKEDWEEVTGYHLGQVEEQLNSARREIEQLLADKAAAESSVLKEQQTAVSLSDHLTKALAETTALQDDFERYRKRIRKAVAKDGQTWTERAPADAPAFKPLDERKTPVIATLNLKGGVGKTTTTANLGVTLSALGYRVLLIDLDLQGSLTGLFVSQEAQGKAYKEDRLLGDFLSASFERESPKLPDYFLPIRDCDGSFIVPTTDKLTYAEATLAVRWRLKEHHVDPRFLMRRELQLKRITSAFDVILMDCPPFLNMCCVNALAAADYLLIPVLPSKQATDRVPKLLQVVKEARENLNADLKIMGILPVRTHQTGMTTSEVDRFSLLRRQCRDVWGLEVPQFERYIPQHTDIREAEDENRPLSPGDKLYPKFLELAREVDGRLPTFCRPKVKRPATMEAGR
jgi:chromosome partitioning protein